MKRIITLLFASAAILSATGSDFDFGTEGTRQPQRRTNPIQQKSAMLDPDHGKVAKKRPVNTAMSRHTPDLPSPEKDTPYITERPNGSATTYLRSGHAVAFIWGYLINTSADGYICEVIKGEAGEIFIKPAFSQYATDGWLQGNISDGVATFTLPQKIGFDQDYYEDEYALKVTYDPELQNMVPSDDQTYRLKLNDDGTITSLQDENDELGLCHWMPGFDGNPDTYTWQGFADSFASMSPLQLKVADVPASVDFEQWYMIDGVTARSVEVGIGDDSFYLRNLSPLMPDGVIKGSYDPSTGKVMFEGGQYQGVCPSMNCIGYAVGATQEYDYFTDWFEYVYAGQIEFTYDAKTRTLKSDNSILFSTVPDDINYFDYIDSPEIRYQSPDIEVSSIDPPILTNYIMAGAAQNFTMLSFVLPVVMESGTILDTSRLSYQIVIDDEPMTFSTADYNDIGSPTTEIPYGFNTGQYGNFYTEGAEHMLAVYPTVNESIGIRSVYKSGEKTIHSPITYVPGYTSAIGITTAEPEAGKEIFFDLHGRRIDNPASGLFIRRTTMHDGTVRIEKVIR